MLNYGESGHPVFRGSTAFERADLKSKGKGRSTFHVRQSAQYLRSSGGHVWRLSLAGFQKLKRYNKTRRK